MTPTGHRDARQLRDAALLALGYCAAAYGSASLFYTGSAAAGLWAANAFAVGFILRAGFSSLVVPAIAVAAGSAIGNVAIGNSLADNALFTAINLFSVLIGVAFVQRRFPDWRQTVASAGNYIQTYMLAGFVAPAIAGCAFALARFILDPTESLYATWWLWASGDILGNAIVLPIALFATRAALGEFAKPRTIGFFALSMAAVITAAAAGSAWTNFPFMILLVPLMVSAVYLPIFMLALSSAATAVTVLLVVAYGPEPSAPIAEALAAYRFQISLAICAMLPLLGALVLEQMRADRRRIAISEQRFRRAMMDSAIGVVVVGLDGQIIETNPAFADMLGYTRAELEQKTFFEITYSEDIGIGAETMQRVRAGEADSYRFEKRYVHKDGTPIWALLFGSVIRDDETNAPLYLVSQIENIDVRRKSEAALAEAETRWDFALAAAGQGVWDLDMKKGQVTYSSTWKHMLGYEEHELDGDPDHWLTLVHPEDRHRVEEADREHVNGNTPMFEAEFRMRHKDGHWVWILDRGKVVERNPDGSVSRAIGTLIDITMRREAEDRVVSYAALLADEKERLRVTLNSIGDAVICTDADNRVTFMNPVAEKLTRVSEAEALEKPLADIYKSVDEETGLVRAGSNQDERSNSRAVLVRADGSRCSIREVVSAITNDKGEFGGSVIVFQDFTDARTLQRELAYAAAHDALTGLANRSSFMQTMEQLVTQDPAAAQQAQFLYIDLDRFKLVNDTGGHAAGDALLKRVAAVIGALMRSGDMVARLGGDEFAAVLKSCTPREAEIIANRIVTAVSTLAFTWNGKAHAIGASIGIAPLAPLGGEIDEIIAHADEACYSAKASGRNCVVVFDAGSTPGPRPSRKREAA